MIRRLLVLTVAVVLGSTAVLSGPAGTASARPAAPATSASAPSLSALTVAAPTAAAADRCPVPRRLTYVVTRKTGVYRYVNGGTGLTGLVKYKYPGDVVKSFESTSYRQYVRVIIGHYEAHGWMLRSKLRYVGCG